MARPQPDIDAGSQRDLRRRADHELARRSLPGAPAYLVLVAILALMSDNAREHAVSFTVAATCFAVFGAVRILFAIRMLRGSPTKRQRMILHSNTLVLGLVWGLFIASLIATHPEVTHEAWMPLLGLLFNGALASGVAASYSPAPKFARLTVVIMELPIIVALAACGDAKSWGLAGVVVLFVFYLLMLIRQLGNAYWSALNDNAELQHQRRELEIANELAHSAAVARERFLANMSHELRTPLNGIIGLTSLSLNGADLDQETRTYLEHVKHSAEDMMALIKQVLDFSDASRGQLSLQVHDFVLHNVLAKIGRSHGPHAHQKDLELILDVDPSLPPEFRGDSHRIGQVLDALVSNAIKFTASGEVILRVEGERATAKTSAAASGWRVRFTITDTGCGISEGQREQIFDAFTQVDQSLTREYQGAGLGLTLAASLVDLLGGRIEVSSVLGEGSVFTVEIGLHDSSRVLARAVSSATQRDRTAREGNSAAASTRLDDSATPLAPGRAPSSPAEPPPGTLPRREPGESPVARGRRILVAEDNRVNQKVAARLLEREGFEVMVAEDGQEAVKILEEERFDLVLTDLQMPRMDGFQLAEWIRNADRTAGRHTPLVALTAHCLPDDRERCRHAGMDGFISKPVQVAELREVLAAALDLAQAA